jgi:signal transduction histidine kinase
VEGPALQTHIMFQPCLKGARSGLMVTDPPPARKGPCSPRRVLVVDDEYGPRESIAYTLATSFSVETAERAAEALRKIKDQHYHVVVLDIRMPEMDGIKALEELRKIDPHVSVIILTGYGMLSTAQQAMVGGANQYMRKPPDVAELIDAVRFQAEAAQLRRQQAKMSDRRGRAQRGPEEGDRGKPAADLAGRASVELVHDLNNPLTVVIGYSALMVEEAHKLAQNNPELGKRMADYAVIVGKAAEYCHHLSENWRTASKKTSEFTLLDIVAVAFEVKQVIFFGSPAIQITGPAGGLDQGLEVRAHAGLPEPAQEFPRVGRHEGHDGVRLKGGKVLISVTDNGPGMDEERIHRVMHGGFTSKENGTGLGLSICRHLIGAHGGEFAIESKPGVGTTIRLTFPREPKK